MTSAVRPPADAASLNGVADAPTSAAPALDVVSLSPEAERAARCGALLVDRSERGKLALTGPDAAECLNGQVTNDVLGLEPGHGVYATFLTTKGQMLGDVRVVRTADTFELDTERASLQALFDQLRLALIGHDAELHKRTLQRGLISLVGPRAREIAHVDDLATAEHRNAPFRVDGVEAHAVGCEAGVDILCGADDTAAIITTLTARGAVVAGEAAYEVCRIERGRPRFGVELDTRTMPQEAGLTDRAVSFTKGCYTGQETVARLFYRGKPNRVLRGLRFDEPPVGDGAVVAGGKTVGRVARVADSPGCGLIALALVRREVEPGQRVECGGTAAEVVELPFRRAAPPASC